MAEEDVDPAGEDDQARTLRRAVEALLLVTEEPLAVELMAQLLEVSTERVTQICHELVAEYDATDRGFRLVQVAGGWRYQTHPDMAPYVERFVLEGQSGRLSNAALETLAIVAYKQPISRAQVAAIRGVNVDGVMRTLTHRGYVDEVGRDPGPGQAVLYGTTAMFLEKLGLNDLDELPPLGDFVPGADVFEALERGLRPDADADAGTDAETETETEAAEPSQPEDDRSDG